MFLYVLCLIIFPFREINAQTKVNPDSANYTCCYDQKQITDLFQRSEQAYRAYQALAKWPTNKIYYDVDPHLDPYIKHHVAKAIDYFNSELETCVWWEQRYPYSSEDKSKHWVTFLQAEEDTSEIIYTTIGWNVRGQINTHIYLGYHHAIAKITEADEFEYQSDVMHEMMHVMGFVHEHQRRDRDCYVFVTDYAIEEYPTAYSQLPHGYFYSQEFPYDYGSIMHFPETEFYMYPHERNQTLWRNNGTLSELDLAKVNYLYCDQPSYCFLSSICLQNDFYARYNPRCFREGPEYNKTTYSCHHCNRPEYSLIHPH